MSSQDPIDEADEETFPASDPPAFSALHAGPPSRADEARERPTRDTEGVAMTAAAKQIFEAALKLDPDERKRLAEALWRSVEHPR